MASSLELTLLYLVAAVAGVVLCRLSRLPPILGYLAVGTLIGPHAMAVSGGDAAGVSHLAEFGIVFLMFVIGLEFNLPKLRSMKKLVFGLGLSQVVLTILPRSPATRSWPGRSRSPESAAWGSTGRARSPSAVPWR
jgi:CPA2 family monovalent cation:H+ antiporter-2